MSMKMYVEPLSKEALEKYLAVTDLTQSPEPHAVRLICDKVIDYMRSAHPDSDVRVLRRDPIVSVEDNYDNLLIAPDNISRSSTYTHYVDATHILRTHTTAQIPAILRELAARDDWSDVVILMPGLAYRRDVSDKKHVGEVHMLEMWRIVRNAARGESAARRENVARRAIVKDDLLVVVHGVAAAAAPGWQLRIEDSPHPYTREGIEVNAVRGDRDIEILECGLINDEILRRAGLDPAEYSGWALGMGLDRLVMTLKDIPDVRYLRSTNPAIAEQMRDLEPYREVSRQPAVRRDMSYCVPERYVEEDISEDIRQSLGDDVGVLESVEVLNETPYAALPPIAREKLGCAADQKNVLVRVTLRRLERSLTNAEGNELYERMYSRINHGSGGYAAK